MLNLKTIGRTATAGALLLVFSCGPVEARPAYMGVFKKAYPELKANKAVKVTCAVCHSSKDDEGEPNKKKKFRNNYGVALQVKLGKANEKDKEKVAKALKEIADEKSHVKDKTFGALIEDGKLPGEDKPAKPKEKKE